MAEHFFRDQPETREEVEAPLPFSEGFEGRLLEAADLLASGTEGCSCDSLTEKGMSDVRESQ